MREYISIRVWILLAWIMFLYYIIIIEFYDYDVLRGCECGGGGGAGWGSVRVDASIGNILVILL